MIVSGWVTMVTMISSFSCVTPEGQCSTPLRTAPPQPVQHTRPDCVTAVHAWSFSYCVTVDITYCMCVRVCPCVLVHACVLFVA